MTIQKMCLLILLIILLCTLFSNGQILPSVDSLLFESSKDDTLWLKRQVIEKRGTKIARKAKNRLGYLAVKKGDWKSAESFFLEAKEDSVESIEKDEAKYFLGRIELRRGNHEASQKYFQEYLNKEPNGNWAEGAEFNLLQSKMKKNDSDIVVEAKSFLKKREKSDYAVHVQFYIVKHYRDVGDYANSIVEAKNLIQQFPNSTYASDLQYQIGGFYQKLGNNDKAKTHFQNIVTTNKKNTEPAAIAQYLLGEIYEQEGNYAKAKNEYGKVKYFNPNIKNWAVLSEYASANSVLQEAKSKNDTIKRNEGNTLFLEYIKNNPKDKRVPKALLTVANSEQEDKEYEKALKTLDEIISFDITNAENVAEGYLPKEREEFHVVERQARLSKGLIYRMHLQDYEYALAEYDAILLQHPDDPDALFGKAMVLLDKGDRQNAKQVFKILSDRPSAVQAMAEYYLTKID